MRSIIRGSAPLFAVLCGLMGCSTPTPPGTDAAVSPVDAAEVVDAATSDSGPPPRGCPLTFSGCTAFDDRTGEAAVVIGFAAAGVLAFDPQCIRVSAGTIVTIPGSTVHPPRNAGCSPTDSPIAPGPTPADGVYTFANAGAYGYFCNVHGAIGGEGMAGLIIVE